MQLYISLNSRLQKHTHEEVYSGHSKHKAIWHLCAASLFSCHLLKDVGFSPKDVLNVIYTQLKRYKYVIITRANVYYMLMRIVLLMNDVI